MTQKHLYLVQHFVPFPSSEYGGIWAVIAENSEECFDLITEKNQDTQYYHKLKQNILNAVKLTLAHEHESKIVEEFIT
jgi:hypothetical protein